MREAPLHDACDKKETWLLEPIPDSLPFLPVGFCVPEPKRCLGGILFWGPKSSRAGATDKRFSAGLVEDCLYKHHFNQDPKTSWEKAADLLCSAFGSVLGATIDGAAAFYESLQE